jgi:hypothetical protein
MRLKCVPGVNFYNKQLSTGLPFNNDHVVRLLYRHWRGLTISCGGGVAAVKISAAGYGFQLADA